MKFKKENNSEEDYQKEKCLFYAYDNYMKETYDEELKTIDRYQKWLHRNYERKRDCDNLLDYDIAKYQ